MSEKTELLLERRDLLERFRAGERRALDEIYRFYVSDVANFLQRGFTFSSGDRTLRFSGYVQSFDLDNALQETFSRAFRQSARLSFDGLHSYRNYLLAIARNLVVDELRGRELATSAVDEDEEPAESSTEHELARRELSQLYAKFIDGLKEPERRFFRSRFEDQATQAGAGAACSLSHMQARTLEKRLRARFLKCMRSNGYFVSESAG
jgi:RNA polymerase sigma factor (sigma-70 family)